MNKLTPSDFKLTVLDEARRQYYSALNSSAARQLDPSTSFWVMTQHGWMEIRRDMEVHMSMNLGPRGRKELMGLPVRVTMGDEPDVPMIQLVMEPVVRTR